MTPEAPPLPQAAKPQPLLAASATWSRSSPSASAAAPGRHRARRLRRLVRHHGRARRWASSARPARASRRWRGRSCRRRGPSRARCIFRGTDLTTLRGARLLQARRHLQMVFQDPFGSLDPKWRVRRSGGGAADRLQDGRQRRPAPAGRRGARPGRARPGRATAAGSPRELSGGQAQRVAIARARGARPGADHLRRGGVLAGRAHPGAGAQPVRAAARRARPVLPVHRARPGPGQAGQRPGGGDVPGQAVRGRAGARRCTASRCTRTRGRCSTRSRRRPELRPPALAAAPSAGEPPSPIHPPSGCRFRTRCPRGGAALRGRGASACASWPPATRSRATSRW